MTAELERSRRRLERSYADFSEALETEFGAAPRFGRWALVVAVAAAGFALAGGLGSRIDRGRLAAGRPRRPA